MEDEKGGGSARTVLSMEGLPTLLASAYALDIWMPTMCSSSAASRH